MVQKPRYRKHFMILAFLTKLWSVGYKSTSDDCHEWVKIVWKWSCRIFKIRHQNLFEEKREKDGNPWLEYLALITEYKIWFLSSVQDIRWKPSLPLITIQKTELRQLMFISYLTKLILNLSASTTPLTDINIYE